MDLHQHTIRKKLQIMVEHFTNKVAQRINGKAKAMIVTRSRLHAVRYKLAIDEYLKEQGYPHRALVAFSGTVRDGGRDYTEANMNGFPEIQTADTFKRPEYRFLIVANKYQTGFDQPLLHTMYVDKKLGGVNAVQTLSRLNRIHPGKTETMVLDFSNEADEIQNGFEPYYEKTLLSEATDPNLLYDLQQQLGTFEVYTDGEVEEFARIYFRPKSTQDQLYTALRPIVDRFEALPEDARADFRGKLTDYVRLYAFLSQVLTFTDADLEKLYVFARLLRRYLPVRQDELPREIQQNIDMESYRVQQTFRGRIDLERGQQELEPKGAVGGYRAAVEDIEPLSQIIRELNDHFGTEFKEEDRVFIRQLEERLAGDPALAASVRSNPPENARLTFDHVVTDRLQDMVETNFEFYKRVTDDREFAKFFVDWLFDRYRQRVAHAPTAVPDEAAKSLRHLPIEEVQPFENCVPIYDLAAAAGRFSDEQTVEEVSQKDEIEHPEKFQWVKLPEGMRPQRGGFVARVVGESMNRRIPNGAWCLFRMYTGGDRNGRILLVQHQAIHDPDHGGHFTVKLYESEKVQRPDGSWEHERIVLKPQTTAPGYEAIELHPDEADDLATIAEFIAVVRFISQ